MRDRDAHAFAGACDWGRAQVRPAGTPRDLVIIVNTSGRGDKDVDTAARWFGLVTGEEVAETELVRAHEGEQPCARSTSCSPAAGPRAARRWSATCRPASRRTTWRSRRMPPWSRAGVDAVEVGMPYTDPLMEGPVIQAAHQAALDAGTRQADVLRTVEAVAATGAPTVVMGYWNPVHRYGFRRWAQALKDAGGVGRDHPRPHPRGGAGVARGLPRPRPRPGLPRRAEQHRRADRRRRPHQPRVRLRRRRHGRHRRPGRARRRRPHGSSSGSGRRPTCPSRVGLGVSTGAQAAQVAGFADGVVVGSALVSALQTGGVDGVRRLAAELAEGVRSPVPA